MSGCVMCARLEGAEGDDLSTLIEPIHRRLRLDLQAEHPPLLHDGLVQRKVGLMQDDRCAERPFRTADAGDVIEMGVGQQDVRHAEGR